jgi:hypothetical protein
MGPLYMIDQRTIDHKGDMEHWIVDKITATHCFEALTHD